MLAPCPVSTCANEATSPGRSRHDTSRVAVFALLEVTQLEVTLLEEVVRLEALTRGARYSGSSRGCQRAAERGSAAGAALDTRAVFVAGAVVETGGALDGAASATPEKG